MLSWILCGALFLIGQGGGGYRTVGSRSFPDSPALPADLPIAAEFFGMHLQCVAAPCGAGARYPFPAGLGFATVRLWDTASWATLEPGKNAFHWNELDWLVKEATAHGVKSFVFTLGDVPAWASGNPGGECGDSLRGQCYPPDLRAMDDFLTTLVRRECGVVRYYEGWNEPNQTNFWRGTNAQLLTITQHLYSIVRSAANCGCASGVCSPGGGTNPNQVLTPAVNTICCAAPRRWMTNWLEVANKSGLHADIVGFHGYESEPEHLGDDVAWLRRLANAHGLAKAEIWDTESSWGKEFRATGEQQAGWLMRSYIAHAAGGVSRFYWYAFGSCAWGPLYGPSCGAAPDHERGMRKAGVAYQTIARWLTGATIESCIVDAEQTWSCTLIRSNGYKGVLVWNASAVRQIKSPAADLVSYRDWRDAEHPLGKIIPVSPTPVLLENKAAI